MSEGRAQRQEPGWTRILTIAGSDSSAGAGVQADLKTAMALGAYATTAITAITAQNTVGVREVFALEPRAVEAQIRAVVDDVGVDAVKIGMLGNAAIARVVLDALRDVVAPIVIDPVLKSTSGASLFDGDDATLDDWLARATLVTPNAPEAEALTREPVRGEADAERAAKALIARGASSVLVKGGHLDATEASDVVDLLVRRDEATRAFRGPRWSATATHGTGCTLSTAIAIGLGRGLDLEHAIDEARAYLTRAVSSTRGSIGRGPHKPFVH